MARHIAEDFTAWACAGQGFVQAQNPFEPRRLLKDRQDFGMKEGEHGLWPEEWQDMDDRSEKSGSGLNCTDFGIFGIF